ncbi:hypothetical protein A2881_02580 [Candidatus Peribacteria bacterium RIFCSPHIGHO2_01_FULL_55_13]|nr:MAG: hypothetical protein A2881_02580 [Candidatus Peribacteria bacterium RIFCSPHIGHO2_01_FULL_55_13]OGJ64152.1 MAG: hypothetical protein A3F36_05190 [Candidatus Peribacteria bacterium RIFCSPHIGHO2_12_FULL_55_11]
MTKLSATQVRHIAKLARLEIGDDEVEKYAKELSAILAYIDQLSEVDTSKVQATAQVTGIKNGMRPDVVNSSPVDREALLATSPLPIVDDQIETPSAHG